MRARLGRGKKGVSWRAICDPDTVQHLCRAVTWAGGFIANQETSSDGVILEISK